MPCRLTDILLIAGLLLLLGMSSGRLITEGFAGNGVTAVTAAASLTGLVLVVRGRLLR